MLRGFFKGFLLDQSISYGNGSVMEKDIKAMLGLVHHDDILTLAKHLFNQDGARCEW
jgi:DNA polymerase-3 subunit gamma/tau